MTYPGEVAPKSVVTDGDLAAVHKQAEQESVTVDGDPGQSTGAVKFDSEPVTYEFGATNEAEVRVRPEDLPEGSRPLSSTVEEPYAGDVGGVKVVDASVAENKTVTSRARRKSA